MHSMANRRSPVSQVQTLQLVYMGVAKVDRTHVKY